MNKASLFNVGSAAGLLGFLYGGAPRLPLLLTGLLLLALRAWAHNRARLLPAFYPLLLGLTAPLLSISYWDALELAGRQRFLFYLSLAWIGFRLLRLGGFTGLKTRCFHRLPLKKRLLLLFLVSSMLFGLLSLALVRGGVSLSGDEPHYLLIARSLARDGDLNIANQHAENQHRAFLDFERLGIHGFFGRQGHSHIYSMHLPGLSFTLVPFQLYDLPPRLLYFLLRLYHGLFAAAAGLFVYLLALRFWRRPALALFLFGVYSFTSPVVFHAVHLFPEIQVTLFLLAALYLLIYGSRKNVLPELAAGLLLGLCLFWGVKYSIFTYAYCAGFSVYFLMRRDWGRLFALLCFPLICQGFFFAYLYHAYGNFSPMSVYSGIMTPEQKQYLADTIFRTITLKWRLETLANFFLDQRDGLLFYNPWYFFALPGFLLVLGSWRRLARPLLLLIPPLLYVINYAALTHRGGYSPQARPLAPVAWALLFLAVIWYLQAKRHFLRRAFLYLPLFAVFTVISQAASPFTLYQPTTHDTPLRPGLLFQQWSSLHLDLPPLLPSFIKINNDAYLPNYIWLGLLGLMIILTLLPLKPLKSRPAPFLMLLLIVPAVFSARPGLHNPLLVERPGILPHYIYAVNPFPQQRAERVFSVGNSGLFSYVLALRREPGALLLELKNSRKNPALEIEVKIFDQLAARLRLDPGQEILLPLHLPKSRLHETTFGFNHHYQLRLLFSFAGKAEKDGLNFQFLPLLRVQPENSITD